MSLITKINKGTPDPLGISIRGTKINFSLFSSNVQEVTLGLFNDGYPVKEIPMHRSSDFWHIEIENIPKEIEYAFRCNRSTKWLIDPYAKVPGIHYPKVSAAPTFDWEGDKPPNIAKKELIIYEMHVRGFTNHPSSHVQHPGTFLGVIEKIPYLKKLGINAVELMPIYQFEKQFPNAQTNYWGYSPIHFFIPMPWYTVKNPVEEFKLMVKKLHQNGIEVILDVVYNHTGEVPFFKEMDKCTYYMINQDGYDLNYSGCGNTLNTNHPIVQDLIINSLQYWVDEMHVDGFRFDLASIFTRGPDGALLEEPPILKRIQKDPVLSKVKLIAEAWDAAGLYQVGLFPKFGHWSEWNGQYRDTVRRFIKGDANQSGNFANALLGSSQIYQKTPISSVNFITAHDGFCLTDLVSFQNKHNEANGEENRDGCNHNDSWNCGVEGPTTNPEILSLRKKQLSNFFLALFCSNGIPMLLMGDEAGHTRKGNNNPYTQDNELNYHLWDQLDHEIFEYVSKLIAFRKTHKAFSEDAFYQAGDVEWISSWNPENRFVSYILKKYTPHLLIAFNASHKSVEHPLPEGNWQMMINTRTPLKIEGKGPTLHSLSLQPYSSLLAIKAT